LKNNSFFVNYYGEQRFGGYRPNLHWAGKEYILGNYERCVKLMLAFPYNRENKDYRTARKFFQNNWGSWKECLKACPRMMTIEKRLLGSLVKDGNFRKALKSLPRQLFSMIPHAYQSYLWNESLSRYLRKYKGKDFKYCCGKWYFVDEYIDLDWPIIDQATKVSGEIKEVIDKLLEEEGVSYEDFDKAKGLVRKAMVRLDRFKVGNFENGVQNVSFFLPAGAYATVAVKSLS
jgi:tRNA pseudouridine13 synthase